MLSTCTGDQNSKRQPQRLRWTGGGTVDEDAFLTMQQECLRIKKEERATEHHIKECELRPTAQSSCRTYMNKDSRRLTARLARTEEAAKRAMVRNDVSARGGTAQHLLDLERKVVRLTAERNEAQACAAKETRVAAELRPRAVGLNKRLDFVLRDQRRLVQQLGVLQQREHSARQRLYATSRLLHERGGSGGELGTEHSGALGAEPPTPASPSRWQRQSPLRPRTAQSGQSPSPKVACGFSTPSITRCPPPSCP